MKKLILLLPVLVACHTTSLDYYNFEFWEGNWESTDSTGTFHENWRRINDTLYVGMGLKIEQNDTIFIENIQLSINASTVYYTVSSDGQSVSIPFKLRRHSKDSWFFENYQHDFPKRISCHLVTADSLVATVDGIEDTIPKSFSFHFKRK